jgi:hypothetical protein
VNLRILSETPTTVTVGWDPVPGAVGYDFYIDAKRVSFTHDGTKTSVKFGKPDAGLHDYGVESLMHGSSGVILVPAPAPPPPPPRLEHRQLQRREHLRHHRRQRPPERQRHRRDHEGPRRILARLTARVPLRSPPPRHEG